MKNINITKGQRKRLNQYIAEGVLICLEDGQIVISDPDTFKKEFQLYRWLKGHNKKAFLKSKKQSTLLAGSIYIPDVETLEGAYSLKFKTDSETLKITEAECVMLPKSHVVSTLRDGFYAAYGPGNAQKPRKKGPLTGRAGDEMERQWGIR